MLMLEFPKAWVLEAIEKARRAHKQTSRYVLGILRAYRKQGGSDDDIAPADHRARGKPSNQAAPPIKNGAATIGERSDENVLF